MATKYSFEVTDELHGMKAIHFASDDEEVLRTVEGFIRICMDAVNWQNRVEQCEWNSIDKRNRI